MSNQQPAVIVKDLYKSFKLPHEQHSGIKQLIINFAKRKKGYEVQRVLNDVSFEIKQGEFFGIVGRNGSGKSTLLKLLAGIYTPDKGHVQINGSLTPFIELGVGFNPELTGRENVFLNGALLGFSRPEMELMYGDIVSFAELERFMDQKLKNYSSGMQVRLAFSIAIRAKSDVLLIDEVLAVGDSAFQQKCFDYFNQLRKEKKTIILVTHDMSAVNRFCDRALYINAGKVEHIGTPEEVADLYLIHNLERGDKDEAPVELSEHASLEIAAAKQDDKELVLDISYKNNDNDAMYVGMSLIHNGIPIAEITTPMDMKLYGTGKLTYTLNTRGLNANVYQISAILCKQENRQLIAIGENRVSFAVTGTDITRGAALKLDHTWRQS